MMIAARHWQVMLGRYVAPLAAFVAVVGLLTLLAGLSMLLVPSVGTPTSRTIRLTGGAMCAGGVLTYLWIGWLVSLGRGRGVPQMPHPESLPAAPEGTDTSVGDWGHSDHRLTEPDDVDMPQWDRLTPHQGVNGQ
jgi:hypothetical protein